MTIWPFNRAASLSANSRGEMSETDPAANGETMRIGRVGNLLWARAGESGVRSSASAVGQIQANRVRAHQPRVLSIAIILQIASAHWPGATGPLLPSRHLVSTPREASR